MKTASALGWIVCAGLLINCAGMFGPPTFRDVLDGKIAMNAVDKAAVVALLRSAGVSSEQFLVRETADGVLASNGVALENGRVVRIVLSSTRLSSTASLAPLAKLREARLESNRLTELAGLSRLSELTTLHAERNLLTSLATLAPCVRLASLLVSQNHLRSTESAAGLTSLHELDLRANEIDELTDLSSMGELRWINLSSNRLTSIGALGVPPVLSVILVDDNRLGDIDALLRVPTLLTVNAQRNRIARVPREASRWRELRLSGNPATAPETTPSVVTPDVPALTRNEATAFEAEGACTQTVEMPCRNQLTGVVCRLELDELRGVVCARFVADRYYRRIGSAMRQPNLFPAVRIPLRGNITAHAEVGNARVYFKPLLQMEEIFLAFSSQARTKNGVFSMLQGSSRGIVIQSATPVSREVVVEYAE